MKQKDVLSCLPKSKKIFDIETIRNKLKKKGFVQETSGRKIYRMMDSLVKENFLEKIDSHHYRIVDVNDKLDLVKYLIKNNLEKGLVAEWDYGSGLLSGPRTEGIFLGIPPNFEFKQEWKGLSYSILRTRLSNIFHAITELLTSVDDKPVFGSNYMREVSLELIPLFIGDYAGMDHDGLDEVNLIKLIENLTQNPEFRDVVHVEDLEKLDKLLTIFKNNLENYNSKSKRPKDVGMVIFSGGYTIDPDFPAERSMLELVGSDLKNGKNAEKIVANVSNYYYPEYLEKLFKKYDGYYPEKIIKKIRELHSKIETGFAVAFCLYDIDYCQKTIDRLESKEIHVGYYDDGNYVGRENVTSTIFGDGGFYVQDNKRAIGSQRSISKSRQVKRKSFYEDIINKTIEKLGEIFRKEGGIDKSLTNTVFAHEIKIGFSPNFTISNIDWKRIFKMMGYTITEDQMQEWITKGKLDAKNFVHKWLRSD